MNTWKKLHDNPSLWGQYFLREKVIKSVRSFFDKEGFHEVETPTLVTHPPAESYIDLFQTTLVDRQGKESVVYLSSSPEVALKKLLVAGIGNCYSLTKAFRNTETGSITHNPEFTILEWYRVNVTYLDIMTDCERLIQSLTPLMKRDGKPALSLTSPWERISVSDAFAKYAGIDFNAFFDIKDAFTEAKNRGYEVANDTPWEKIFNQVFLNEVEPHLGKERPTFLYDFPSSLAALSKKKESDPRFAERFELYIDGLELADCYTELTDWKEQEDRFKKELEEMKRGGKELYDYDHDFIDALKVGLPPCAGIAMGVDRLLMLLLGAKTIEDTMLFPPLSLA